MTKYSVIPISQLISLVLLNVVYTYIVNIIFRLHRSPKYPLGVTFHIFMFIKKILLYTICLAES